MKAFFFGMGVQFLLCPFELSFWQHMSCSLGAGLVFVCLVDECHK